MDKQQPQQPHQPANMATYKMLLNNPAKHYMVSSKSPHEYIITSAKQVSRAILVGVSFYFASDRVFTRYFDTNTGQAVVSDKHLDFDLCMRIPWLETEDDSGEVRVKVQHKQYEAGKKTMRFKVDSVYCIKTVSYTHLRAHET